MSSSQTRLAELTSDLLRSKISSDFFVNTYGADRQVSDRITEYITREGSTKAGGKVKSKEIRPTYVFAAAEAAGVEMDKDDFNYGNQTVQKYFYPALSLKMDHEWMLIDDDIQDGGLERRGGPAYHIQHGVNFAINDSAYIDKLSTMVMAEAEERFGTGTYNQLAKIRTGMHFRTVNGQNLDMRTREDVQLGKVDMSDMKLNIVTKIHILKSSYTNRTGVEYGLTGAGWSHSEIDRVVPLMDLVTESFQGIDDLQGSTKDSGKGFAPDLDERKVTKLILKLFHEASMEDRDRVREIFVRGTKDDVIGVRVPPMEMYEKKELIDLIQKYKVAEYVENEAIEKLEMANEGIVDMFGEKRAKELIELNNFCVYRKF